MMGPPSSRRRRTQTDDIKLSDDSYEMRRLVNLTVKRSEQRQAVPLIIGEEDALEQRSFLQRVGVWRRETPMVIVPEGDKEFWKTGGGLDELSPMAGLALLGAGKLDDAKVQKLAIRYNSKNPQPPQPVFVAIFSSRREYETSFRKWPEPLRKIFLREALSWPKLKNRKADLLGIMDAVCQTLKNEDNCRQAMLADEARDFLLKTPFDHARAIRRLIVHAFDVMLERGAPCITSAMLLEARRRARGHVSERPPAEADVMA